MGCPPGALDLSLGLFKYIAPNGDGVVYGTWNWGAEVEAPRPNTTKQTSTTTRHTPSTTPKPTSHTSSPKPESSIATSSSPSFTYSATTATASRPAQPSIVAGNLAALLSLLVEVGNLAVEAPRKG